ncbi:MAG: hypothetical protein KAW92_13765 [Candidatus Cloacimonetes bacterium]|nr:hypothetical protein [Candidatus Cloacimonadota bacterium]
MKFAQCEGKKFNFVVYGQTESLGSGSIDKTTLSHMFAKVEENGAIVSSVVIPGKDIGRGYFGMMWGAHFYLDDKINPENVLLVIEPRSLLNLMAESIPKPKKKL